MIGLNETRTLVVAPPSGSLTIYNAPDKGKYKGIHRIKTEVHIEADAVVGPQGLMDVPFAIVLGIPNDRVADHLKHEVKKAQYEIVVNQGGSTITAHFDDRDRAMDELQKADQMYSDFDTTVEAYVTVDGRRGEAPTTRQVFDAIEQLPFELKMMFHRWAQQVPDFEGIDQRAMAALLKTYEEAEKK